MREYVKYIGIPYAHKGRTMQGLDCWGLPILYYRELFKVELLDFDNYEQDWSRQGQNLFLENYSEQFEQIEKPEKHCIILFWGKNKQVVNHCGIYIGNGKFIQCTNANVVISRLITWKSRVQGYYKLKDDYFKTIS